MKGILYVESRPASPDRDAEYNRWYDEVHLGEVVALDGIVSARRFSPVTDDGPYVAVYELEADDLNSVVKGIMEAATSGGLNMSDALGMDPPPTLRLLRLTAECPAVAAV